MAAFFYRCKDMTKTDRGILKGSQIGSLWRHIPNAARRIVECFFDNVIIEATVQFVEENQESVRRLHAGLKPAVAMRNSFSGITHLLREPLGPLLLRLEVPAALCRPAISK